MTKEELENKILYLREVKYSIVFRNLYHTVITVCDFIRPLKPDIDSVKYLEYFIKNIDFEKISESPSKVEIKKYCYTIYYGLEELLKKDIENILVSYQTTLDKLNIEQIKNALTAIIPVIGNLKMHPQVDMPGTSFTARFNLLCKQISKREEMTDIDYGVIITTYNETII